jgi:uncharacterized protein YyaL (SSP411 family)
LLEQARKKMFDARSLRIHPGRDEKILTSWNALMIKGMAIAARYLDHNDYAESAQQALDFVYTTLWKEQRLMATHKDGKTHLNAYLDDYAYLIDAILEFLQYRWNSEYLNFACSLADTLLAQFEDPDHGGFYFTANDHENLIQRPKPYTDEATPAGNGIAAYAFQRLGYLVGNTDYLDAAERCLKDAGPTIEQHPYACMALLIAMEEHKYPVKTVIVRGESSELVQWREKLPAIYHPRQQVYFIGNDCADIPEALAAKKPNDSIVAYICEGMSCAEPVRKIDEVLTDINQIPDASHYV